MKAIFKIAMGAMMLLAACQTKSSKIQNFISGSYTHIERNEYAVASDTLVFTQASDTYYRITRNVTYQAIGNGKLLPKHHKVQYFDAIYNKETQLINETTTGRIFRFDPDQHLLRVGQAVYYKLN